jgi:MFS family permease
MFVFVFYFQGVQGDTPILAGLKLAPLAVGMLVASPIAGIYADRNGSRALASIGMLVTAFGLGLMTTLQENTSYLWPGLFMFIVGVGSGMFNSPNTAAMMGVVAPHRRGIASGARVLVQNTGAVLSIAFVMAVVTNGIPKNVLFSIFSGLGTRITSSQLDPFLSNMHFALWCMTGLSVLGAVVSFARPKHVAYHAQEAAPAQQDASAQAQAATGAAAA